MKLLVIEDNHLLGKSIKRGMEECGWVVDLAVDGMEGLYYFRESNYDLMVIDWMLPKLSGLDVLKKVRAEGYSLPVIMVTARDAIDNRVSGLDSGADDYLIKPFEMTELMARVRALYRRSIIQHSGGEFGKLQVGPLVMDSSTQEVFLDAVPIKLTRMEFDLLFALATKKDTLVGRNVLKNILYPMEGEPDSNSVDVVLARVRKKLSNDSIKIITVRNKGFILSVAPAST